MTLQDTVVYKSFVYKKFEKKYMSCTKSSRLIYSYCLFAEFNILEKKKKKKKKKA